MLCRPDIYSKSRCDIDAGSLMAPASIDPVDIIRAVGTCTRAGEMSTDENVCGPVRTAELACTGVIALSSSFSRCRPRAPDM